MRFGVATVTGYRSTGAGSTRTPPGLSCHVVDHFNNDGIVASFRSEDRRAGALGFRGRQEALRDAHALADELNRLDEHEEALLGGVNQ